VNLSKTEYFRIIKIVFSFPFLLLIKIYQYCISPFTRSSCRFVPSCSQYGIEALKHFGPIRGSILTIWRIIRCNPWGSHGYDPVPEKFSLIRKKH
jgi:putative membrane protein insertion efficiency factor